MDKKSEYHGQPCDSVRLRDEDRPITDFLPSDCEPQFTRSASIALGENSDHWYSNVQANTGKLPDSNPKSQYGVKKPPLLSCVPATALLVEGQVMALGAKKYGPFNWRSNSVASEVYMDAAIRHLMAWNSGQDNDPESGVSHLGHVRACMGILIDAMETGNLIDNRPKDEVIAAMLERYTNA